MLIIHLSLLSSAEFRICKTPRDTWILSSKKMEKTVVIDKDMQGALHLQLHTTTFINGQQQNPVTVQ